MAASRSIIGIDLGGTKIAGAKYSDSWERSCEQRVPTHAEMQIGFVVEELLRVIDGIRDAGTCAVGVGVPGLVLQPQGVVVTMPNIPGARNIALKEDLQKRIGLPVFLDNDAHCFTLAEALHGAGKDHRVVAGITLGTGVGGGIVIDGVVFGGSRGCAAEIGHMLLRPGEPPYKTSDLRGDVEQFLSGTALGKRCEQAYDPHQYLEGAACQFLHASIAKEVAWMCTNIIHLIDPSIIVFGGSVGRALAPHLPEILRDLRTWLLPDTPLPKLAIGTLPDAGTLGAALLARSMVM
jgi:glucokinase